MDTNETKNIWEKSKEEIIDAIYRSSLYMFCNDREELGYWNAKLNNIGIFLSCEPKDDAYPCVFRINTETYKTSTEAYTSGFYSRKRLGYGGESRYPYESISSSIAVYSNVGIAPNKTEIDNIVEKNNNEIYKQKLKEGFE
jgi:hypothetical protein